MSGTSNAYSRAVQEIMVSASRRCSADPAAAKTVIEELAGALINGIALLSAMIPPDLRDGAMANVMKAIDTTVAQRNAEFDAFVADPMSKH